MVRWVKIAAILGAVVVALFYIPVHRPISDAIVGVSSVGVMLYWIILTVVSIVIGLKVLERTLGGERR